jgi:multidrug efflux pump subunit AcrA (membrane-fusion protein)
MFARVRFPITALDQVILVPRDAILEDDRGTYLYVVDHSTRTARRRYLLLDHIGPEEAAVKEGLSPGEIIVVRGHERLHDGAAIEWTASPLNSSPRESPTSTE